MGADINWKFTYPAVEYDPISKKIILVSRAGMQIYDPISRILSQALSYNSGGLEIVQNLVYYPPNGKMYYMLNNGRVFEVTLNRTNFSLSTIIEVI